MAELRELIKQSPDPAQQQLMAAHFSSKLEVSPKLFLEQDLPEKTMDNTVEPWLSSPPLPAIKHVSTNPLPGKERQLIEFLVFYPEFFNKLLQGGLQEYGQYCSSLLQIVIQAMQQLAKDGSFLPEQVLAVLPDDVTRQEIAELLLRGPQDQPENEEWADEYCSYLLNWLKLQKQRQLRNQTTEQNTVALLQKKIFTLWQ